MFGAVLPLFIKEIVFAMGFKSKEIFKVMIVFFSILTFLKTHYYFYFILREQNRYQFLILWKECSKSSSKYTKLPKNL